MKKPVIALALGIGSARGLAHIGVLKVLEKNNIPVSIVAGTSMGAIIGAFYAHSLSASELERIALSIDNKKMFRLMDPSLNMGFIGGKKVMRFLKDNLGDVSFKDLKIPLTIVATDLRSGDPVYFEDGDLVSAIRASISIPLVFSPYKHEDLLLIDGHLSEPVPVNAVLRKNPDIVIAVNLDSSGNLLNEMRSSFFGVARRTTKILFYHLAKNISEKANVVICPEVDISYFASFSEVKEIIRKGELAAEKALPEIKKLIKNFDK